MTTGKGLSERYRRIIERAYKQFGFVPGHLVGLMDRMEPADVVTIYEYLLDENPEIARALSCDEDEDQDDPAPLAMEIPDETRKLYGDGREVQ